jgi:hypothetical protein
MILQRGFFTLALYLAWIYAQMVLIIVLVGSLLSNVYEMRANIVGASVLAVGLAALLAIPMSRANYFSRAR